LLFYPMGAPPQLLPLCPAGWLLPPPWQLLLQQCRAGQAALATLARPCSPLLILAHPIIIPSFLSAAPSISSSGWGHR
jgi:hypothetical protein